MIPGLWGPCESDSSTVTGGYAAERSEGRGRPGGGEGKEDEDGSVRGTGGDGEHREEDLKERGEEGAQGHWVSLAPEVKTRERHAEEACRVLRQQLPVAVEEYVSEQLEGKRKREGEDDWPARRPRHGAGI